FGTDDAADTLQPTSLSSSRHFFATPTSAATETSPPAIILHAPTFSAHALRSQLPRPNRPAPRALASPSHDAHCAPGPGLRGGRVAWPRTGIISIVSLRSCSTIPRFPAVVMRPEGSALPSKSTMVLICIGIGIATSAGIVLVRGEGSLISPT